MTNENLDKHEYADNGRLFNNVQRLPLEVTEASGSGIAIEGGGSLLDYWGDEGVCALGYNSPEYRAAVETFLNTAQPHQLPDVYPHRLRQMCAEMLCQRTGMDKVFYANSGTEANEAAIKLARKHWWDREGQPMETEYHLGATSGLHRSHPSKTRAAIAKRSGVVTVTGNFHGRTGLSMAASDPRVSPYHRWGFGPAAKGFGVIDWDGGTDSWRLAVKDGEPLPDPVGVPWDNIAAVILAPVLGNNVVTTYPPEFWRSLASLRDATGVLIIMDDVQAGMGRAGSVATWSQYDLKPDIMTLGKGIAMGHPMSAMLARAEVAEAFTPGTHFNTFGGSPFSCHMAMEMMRWLDEHLDEVLIKGSRIRTEFNNRAWIADCDGAGMLNAFTPDYAAHGYNGYDLCHASRERGLSLMTHRPLGPIRFTPPLNVTESELDTAFKLLDEAHEAAK